jgi:glycosyltransferase involved in cell wall biosynthesis
MVAPDYDWLILNQSQSVVFQQMMGRLAATLGPALLLTGMPHDVDEASSLLTVQPGPTYARGEGPAKRAMSWLAFTAVSVRCLAAMKGRPFLLVVTNPPMLPHLAWVFKRLRGMRYGILIWDVYPEHIVRMGWMSAAHPAIRGWEALNRWALGEAEVVITLGERMAEVVAAQAEPGQDVRIEVIPNWSDTTTITPIPKETNPFAQTYGQVGRTTVLYSGNMGAAHGLLPLVDAARRLTSLEEVSFLLIGDGLGRADVEMAIARQDLSNVTLLDYQPWSVLPQSLATADIAVVIEGSGSEGLSVPSKTYNALAAGSAILALTAPESDLAKLVNEHRVGRVCGPNDPEVIARTIRELVTSPDLGTMRAKARELAVTAYSPDAIHRRLLAVLEPLVSTSGYA